MSANPTKWWPASLPRPRLQARQMRPVSPLISARFASGRDMQRRAYSGVPVEFDAEWLMTSAQATRFEEFFEEDVSDGVLWFWMPVALPQAPGYFPVQFRDVYSGPEPLGPAGPRRRWIYRAPLRIFLRPGQLLNDPEFLRRVTDDLENRVINGGDVRVIQE